MKAFFSSFESWSSVTTSVTSVLPPESTSARASETVMSWGSAFPCSAKPSTEAFDRAMRKLWEDHVTWTRLFIVSASADLPDLEATTDRLLRNQTDIGDAIAPYYGVDAGAHLTALLRDHILGAADLLVAAKAGDDAAVQQATDAWYANGDDIAGFLLGTV